MIVAVNVPNFLPYTGFWNRMLRADEFVLVDTAKYKHRDYHNRVRIRSEDGWSWFTVPVNRPKRRQRRFSPPIGDIRLRPSHELSLSWAILESTYRGRAPYWDTYAAPLKEALSRNRLLDVNLDLIYLIREWLEIDTPVRLSSETTSLVSEDFLFFALHVAEELDADFYLSGAGNIGTVPARFSDRKLKFLFQEFINIPYPQVHPGWQPRMSIVDCLLTHGAEYTRRVVAGGWGLEENDGRHHCSEERPEQRRASS
jgi:hypothetical protein